MSAKDGILHAMKWTVKDEFNHKMEVSNAVDGCVIFYPHNDMVQISYEDLEKLIENLRKPNSNYIRKNSEEKDCPIDDYIRDEREKRLATKSEDPDIKDLETAAQEFADNFHGKFNKEDMTLTVPKDKITIDECATWVERFNLPYKYVSTTFTDYIIQL